MVVCSLVLAVILRQLVDYPVHNTEISTTHGSMRQIGITLWPSDVQPDESCELHLHALGHLIYCLNNCFKNFCVIVK